MARKSFLFAALALLAAAGLAYTAAHKDHGSMIPPDEVEWTQREGSPIGRAVLWGARARVPTCGSSDYPRGSWRPTTSTRAIITALT